MTYKLRRDVLCQMRWRDYYTIEANSLEEAIEQLKEENPDGSDTTEPLYDTYEELEDSNGEIICSIEQYQEDIDDYKLVYEND